MVDGWTWVRAPSGAGKSQLLRAVAGLLPHDGEVLLDGSPRDGASWRARVTYVAQDPPADESTPREWWERVRGLAAQRDRAGEDPVALSASWGLSEDRWDVAMGQLSGGERQRAWLALALARRPDMLLLDEPTSALDAGAREAVVASLKGRRGLLVTHDEQVGEALATSVLELT